MKQTALIASNGHSSDNMYDTIPCTLWFTEQVSKIVYRKIILKAIWSCFTKIPRFGVCDYSSLPSPLRDHILNAVWVISQKEKQCTYKSPHLEHTMGGNSKKRTSEKTAVVQSQVSRCTRADNWVWKLVSQWTEDIVHQFMPHQLISVYREVEPALW